MFDQIAGSTKLKLSGKAKVILAFTSFLAVMLGNSLSHIAAIVIFSVIILYSGVKPRLYLKMLTIPLLFIIPGIIVISIINGEERVFWIIKKEGLETAFNTFLRSFSSITVLYFLITTTTLPEIFSSLRKITPSFVLEIATLMYRAIQILVDEIFRIKRAQEARLGYINFKRGLNSFSFLINVLLIKSFKRAEKFSIAMENRCYTGKIPHMDRNLSFREIIIILLINTVIILPRWFDVQIA